MVGDPVRDFMELAGFAGRAFIAEVVAAYPLDLDPHFGARLDWASKALSLYWLSKAEPGHDLEKHQRWVRTIHSA
jgi:hypothetical protein